MRVTFFDGEKTRSGLNRNSKMVYKSYKNDTISIMRRHVRPRITEHNILKGLKLKAAANIWKDVGDVFKDELKIYAELYNKQHQSLKKNNLSGYNIFTKVLCQQDEPFEDIDSVIDLLGSTIATWIKRGLLPEVKTTVVFNTQIDE